MSMSSDKPLRIIRTDRIERILNRLSSSKLAVLIRPTDRRSLAIRARAGERIALATGDAQICFTDISEKGSKALESAQQVQVEIVGTSPQILFNTELDKMDNGRIWIPEPKELLSYNRRSNARFSTTEKASSFISLGCWSPHQKDITAPPCYVPFISMGSWIRIADLSEGGFCGVSRFPSVIEATQQGRIDKNAKIIFPLHSPLAAPIEIRWVRKIKENSHDEDEELCQRFYKFGAEFVEPSEELTLAVKQFIRQLSISEAI